MNRALAPLLLLAVVACHERPQARPDPSPDRIVGATKDAAVAGDAAVTVRRPDSPVGDLVKRLIARPPQQMSDLEASVGPIQMSFSNADHDNMGFLDRPRGSKGEFSTLVPRLSVRYGWDMYHQDPTRPRDVSITELRLEIRGDPHDAEQVLRDHFGAPRTVVDKTDATSGVSYAAFDPFYLALDPGNAGTFQLLWYATMPRFAIPDPDPAKRVAWLKSFEQRLATAKSVDEINMFCQAAPPDAGIKITGTLNTTANSYGLPAKDGRDFWIELYPPVRATVLADAFHWSPVIAVSHDVHMSSWHLERRDGNWLPLTGADTQWEIEASLTEHPHDSTAIKKRSAAEGAHPIAADDEISHFAIRPRFK
jgi:hypothetical protein